MPGLSAEMLNSTLLSAASRLWSIAGSMRWVAETGIDVRIESLTEVTTIAAAAFTDTGIKFPAASMGLGTAVRVSVAIPTAATFDVGVSGATTRYGTGISTAIGVTSSVSMGTTTPSLYAAATSLRLTPHAVPASAAGRVRVTLFFLRVVAV
jgi:hypothetical protein